MKVRVEVVSLNTDGEEQRRQVLTIERQELAMETLGVNLTEGKALLAGVQDFVVAQQAREELEQRRACPRCRRRYTRYTWWPNAALSTRLAESAKSLRAIARSFRHFVRVRSKIAP